MFESICSIPLSSDLFKQALHPIDPVLAVGLAAGHVECFRLPSAKEDENEATAKEGSAHGLLSTTAPTSIIETKWRTRRHKGSCRYVGFDHDGQVLYSTGTDGLVKAASTETGQVIAKIAVPPSPRSQGPDHPTLLHALSPQSLLLATDSCALHIYDIRTPTSLSARPCQTYHPHEDYVSSLTPLRPSDTSTSAFSKQWITTGGTTIALTDIRRGVLVKSEDQEDELLSSLFVDGLRCRSNRSKGEKLVVGSGDGVVTLWEHGVWDDQDERIIVDKNGESLDVLTRIPDGLATGSKSIVVGCGDGTVRIVQLGINKVVGVLRHDLIEAEGVVGLDFDVEGRMLSGGGSTVKIWRELETSDVDDDEEDGEDSSDSNSEAESRAKPGNSKVENRKGVDITSDTTGWDTAKSRKKRKRVQDTGVLEFDLD